MSDERMPKIYGRTIRCEIWYPRAGTSPDAVEVDLVDVRASDGIRITFDFERDGWVIQQPTQLDWDEDDPMPGDPRWKESAFVPSWQHVEDDEDDNPG